jgi:hypothetical protein
MNTMKQQKKASQRLEQMLGALIAVIIALTPVCVLWTLKTQHAIALITS